MAQSLKKTLFNTLVMSQLKTVVTGVCSSVKSLSTTSLQIQSSDPIYVPLFLWLKDRKFDTKNKKYRYLTAPGSKEQIYGPNYGTYTFWYGKKPIWVRLEKEANSSDVPKGFPTPESITLSSLVLNSDALKNIMTEVKDKWDKDKENKIIIHDFCGWQWYENRSMVKRPTGVVLAEGLIEEIEKDLLFYKENKEYYEHRNMPYRKAYLLVGPPGTGKTSLIKQLAVFLDYNIYEVTAKGLDSANIVRCFGTIPKKSLVVIEDIDALYSKRLKKNDKIVDFSKLINTIDGLTALEEVLFVLTTNDESGLDEALLRKGRIDKKFEIGLATKYQAKKIFDKFFSSSSLDFKFFDGQISTADVQDICVNSKNDVEAAEKLTFCSQNRNKAMV